MPAVLGGVGLLVGLALGVPVGAVIYLIVRGGNSTVPPASLVGARRRTPSPIAASAGVIATVAALPIALLSVRFPRREVRLLERSNMLILAVPGLVIALSAAYFTEHLLAGFLYQTPLLLILVYAIMFFPMAVVSVRAAVARSPVGLEEVGHSLGVRRSAVFWRVTLPAHRARAGGRLLPGLLGVGHRAHGDAGPASRRMRRPWPPSSGSIRPIFRFSQAAPYAGVILLIAAIPSYVLGRWFDRLPARTASAQATGPGGTGTGAGAGAQSVALAPGTMVSL